MVTKEWPDESLSRLLRYLPLINRTDLREAVLRALQEAPSRKKNPQSLQNYDENA